MGAVQSIVKSSSLSPSKDSNPTSPHEVKKCLENTTLPSTYLKTVTKLQSRVRGNQSRKKVKVKRLTKGIISVCLQGDSSLFERVGIQGLNTQYGHKKISLLSLSPSLYSGSVIGGDKCFNAMKASKVDLETFFGREETVYVNGGFFNLAQFFYPTYEEHAPIGRTIYQGQKEMPSIPLPKAYETQYGTLAFSDGTCLSSAPILVKRNQLMFDEALLQNRAYQYESVYGRYPYAYCYPGELYHASHPNPRTAISFPDGVKTQDVKKDKTTAKSDRIRLLITTSPTRGKKSTGFDLSEWSKTLLRISQMNKQPGSALNLDGGGSSVMGVAVRGKKIFQTAQDKDGVSIPNFIAFTKKKESDKRSSVIKLTPTVKHHGEYRTVSQARSDDTDSSPDMISPRV